MHAKCFAHVVILPLGDDEVEEKKEGKEGVCEEIEGEEREGVEESEGKKSREEVGEGSSPPPPLPKVL